MDRWTAIIAVVCGISASASIAQEQVLEAKASFIFNGEQIKISRDAQKAARHVATFASQIGTCGAPCIAPMQVAPNIPTLGETEVLAFLVNEVAGDQGLLVDARMPDARAQGYIPGSVSLPHATMEVGNSYRIDILKALGARALDGSFNFSDARSLLIYDTGPSTNDAGQLITNLLAAGYPAAKIKYYRGGMQVWSVLGFSIEDDAS